MTVPIVLPERSSYSQILVACIGNIFLGDDGFGVEVAQRLLAHNRRRYPENVRIIDFGIRGLELAYTLLDPYDALVLVDAVPRGNVPGTLYLLELAWPDIDPSQGMVSPDAHSMDPVKVLAFARSMGARPIDTWLIGCEPSASGDGSSYMEMQMGLSIPVQNAVDEAVKMVDSLLERLRTQTKGEVQC